MANLLIGVFFAVIGGAMAASALEQQRIECDRGSGSCRIEAFGKTIVKPLATWTGVAIERVERRGGRGAQELGVVTLELDGAKLSTMLVDPRQARLAAEELDRMRTDRGVDRVSITLHRDRAVALFAVPFVLLAGLFVRRSLYGIGRYRLLVDAARRRIDVTRTVLGLPIASFSVDAHDARELRFDEQVLSRGRIHWPDDCGYRIVLQTARGAEPLTRCAHRGRQVHRRAATELARRLDLAIIGAPAEAERVGASDLVAGMLLGAVSGAGMGLMSDVLLRALLWPGSTTQLPAPPARSIAIVVGAVGMALAAAWSLRRTQRL